MRRKFQFWNALGFFPEVGHRMPFGIHVYAGSHGETNFDAIFNIFRPETIQLCQRSSTSSSPLPGLKTDDGEWQRAGHHDRIVGITTRTLNSLKKIFEDEETPASFTRLPKIHGRQILSVLEKMGAYDKRLRSLNGLYYHSVMFDETYAQRDGFITRSENPTYIPHTQDELVLSGPIINIATPWSKQARTVCRQKSDYDAVDLTEIGDNFLPRAVYRPGDGAGSVAAFQAAIDEWPKPSLPGFWPGLRWRA